MRMISCQVDAEFDGQTIEAVLRSQLRASVRCIRRAKQRPGGILLDGEPAWTPMIVHAGQSLSLAIDDDPANRTASAEPEPGPISAVYADRDLVIINKPVDMVMYPGPGHSNGTLLNRMLAYFAEQGIEGYPHAANRIDRGTTGLVVFATTSYAKEALQRQLHSQAFERTYVALCEGVFEQETGTVDAPIARLKDERISFTVDPAGKPAVTHYRVLASAERVAHASGGSVEREGSSTPGDSPAAYSLVELKLETGRTHQIRLHMAYIGHPLLGDAAYGNFSPLIARPALHSWRLALEHPLTGERVECAAPFPQDMALLFPEGLAIPQ